MSIIIMFYLHVTTAYAAELKSAALHIAFISVHFVLRINEQRYTRSQFQFQLKGRVMDNVSE